MSKMFNPVVVSGLGFALSVGAGVALSWRTLAPLIEAAAAAPSVAPKDSSELKRKGWDFWTIEIENLSSELKEERLRLRKQAEALEQRAARLAAEEKEFATLRANMEALRKQIADKVTVMCFSEFGRRVEQNSTDGTDHGAAGPMFVCGPKVNGGLHGTHPSLENLSQGDLAFTTDFRTVYAAILDKWLNWPAAPILGEGFPPADVLQA